MRPLFTMILGMILSGTCLLSQTDSITEISFKYDSSGNRVERAITYFVEAKKSAEVVNVEEELELEKGLNVYPNPASHILYVTLNQRALEEDQRMIIIYNNLGKQVIQRIASQSTNEIDVSMLPVGTYILKLIYGHRHKEWIIVKN